MLKYNRFSFFILILFKLTVLISNTENTDKYNPYKPKICDALNNC